MKKGFILCVTAFFLLVAVNQAMAQDISNTIGVGARAFYYFPKENELFGTTGEVEDEIAVGVNLTYIVIPYFSLELAWNYFKTDIEEGSFERGEITTTPILLTAQFRLLPDGPLVPYVGAGVGYYLNDIEVSAEAKASAQSRGISYATDVDDSLGLHLNAGLDWFLTDNFALNLDTKYFWSETDVDGIDTSSAAAVTDDLSLESWVIGSGVKLYF